MRSVSENYINYINSSLVRQAKSKFVIDNVHYTGKDCLVSYPKVEHKTDKAIGSFPAKTCELEILNRNGTFDLHGKEVTVYRGLNIGGTTEWVRIGVFMASDDNIKTNINKKTITFKGTDKTQLLDKPYGGRAQWDVSRRVLHIVKEICDRNGIELATNLFPLNDYVFPDTPPGLDFDNITDRQMISYIAELGGSVAMFTHNGMLAIKKPSDTGVTFPKSKYKSLSVENAFGPINAISFGHKDYEDSLLFKQNGVTDDTKVEWAINDNPLTTTTDKDNLVQKVSEHFFGRSFVPFEVDDIIDDYIFDLNDTVTIEKKDGSTVNVTLLELTTSSRIKSKFGATLQTPGKSNTALAGSVKERLGKVELLVDHQNNIIKSLVDDGQSMQTSINQTAKTISAYAKAVETIKTKQENLEKAFSEIDIEGTVTTEVQKETTLNIIAGKIEGIISGKYASKSDLGDYVKNKTYTAKIEATDKQITSSVERISKIETAGYITESQAESIIDSKADSIAMSVTSKLNIGTRNILLDSACFENAKVLLQYSNIITLVGIYQDYVYENSALPSGKSRTIRFKITDGTRKSGIYFNSEALLGQKAGEIDKILPNKIYTLSFYAKGPEGQQIDLANLLYAGSGVRGENISNSDLTLTNEWKKYTFTFKLLSAPTNFLIRLFTSGEQDSTSFFAFSSLKLEEGNVATDWTPCVQDTEQFVEAKLELCVKTDENGNLQSAIHAKANQITIESDYFQLTANGKVTATSGLIGGWTINENELSAETIKEYPRMTQDDVTVCMNLSSKSISITDELLKKYDVNGDGIVNSTDLALVLAMATDYEKYKQDIGTIKIDPTNFEKTIYMSCNTCLGGYAETAIGVFSVKTQNVICNNVTTETAYITGFEGATAVSGKNYAWLAVEVETGKVISVGG